MNCMHAAAPLTNRRSDEKKSLQEVISSTSLSVQKRTPDEFSIAFVQTDIIK